MVFLAGVVILSYVGQRKTTQQRAFGTGATLKLSTATANLLVGDEFVVEAKIDAAEKITMYRLAITYDKTKLAIIPIAAGMETSAGFEVGPKFGYVNGFVKDDTTSPAVLLLQSAYKVPESGVRNPADLPTGNNTLLARFRVRALAAGSTQIAFRDLGTIINGFNAGNDDVVVSVTTKTPLVVTIGESTRIGQVNVKLDPSVATKSANQNFDVDIKVEAGTFKINFMQLGLNFDQNKLQIVGFTPGEWATVDMFPPEEQELGNASGSARLFAATMKATLPTGTFTAGKLTLKGKVDGVAALTIKKDSASTFGGETADGTQDGTFSIRDTVDGVYTIGAGGAGPVLNFKIKFQGVTTKRADQKVKMITDCKGADSFSRRDTFPDINVSANDSGIYSGSLVLPERFVQLEPKCAIFIKGPKHLARKLCENNQEVRCTAGKSISLRLTNDFDFSKLPLEAGDLPNPNLSNVQDGVVNSVDASLIEARIAKSDAVSIGVADVNFDGIVNWGDMSLLLNTLETKYEEDY